MDCNTELVEAMEFQLSYFRVGNWSWWLHFLRGDGGKSTRFGVLMEMLRYPWGSLMVKSGGSWLGRYMS